MPAILPLILGAMALPMLSRLLQAPIEPSARNLEQRAWSKLPILPLPHSELAEAHRRELISWDTMLAQFAQQGLNDEQATTALGLTMQHLPPEALIIAKRREVITEENYLTAMARHGFTAEQSHVYTKVAEYFPTPQDLISWLAREVFEPDSIARFGLLDEFESLNLGDFAKAGVSEEQARNFWVAHWDHPSWTQVQRFRHYGSVDDDDVYNWFRMVEIPPFWREKFLETLFEPPTRVDTRRMWELGVFTDAQVVEAYQQQGYSPERAQQLLVYTKLERSMPTIKARYSSGLISDADVRTQLLELGVPPERVDFILVRIIKPEKVARTAKEKDLTKTEIVKGVQKKVLTLEQGMALLGRMGYDPSEAEIILRVNIEALTGSPHTFAEFLRLTEGIRQADGLSSIAVDTALETTERTFGEAYQSYLMAKEGGDPQHTLDRLYAMVIASHFQYASELASHNLPIPTLPLR